MNLTEFFKKRIFCLITNPRRGITIAWMISLVLVFTAFIVACVAASRLQKNSSSTKGADNSAAFAAMWTSLLLIFLSVLGTIIMRRYKAALPIGFFLGVIWVIASQMLILFAFFAEHSGKDKTVPPTAVTQSEQAMAVFSFFLFLVYGFFGMLLGVFRYDIIVEENVDKPGPYGDQLRDAEQPPEYN